MMRIAFEWDEKKNKSNLAKHGIDFQTASEVFFDPFQIAKPDQSHTGEQRWSTMGQAGKMALVVVIHVTFEDSNAGEMIEVIRIISARPATRHERKGYENVQAV